MTITRREFLSGLVAAGALATVLDGCGVSAKPKAVSLVHRAKVGAYVNVKGLSANPIPSDALTTFEAQLGSQFNVISYYFGWGSNFQAAINANVPERDLMISWNPSGADIANIYAGKDDPYISQYAVAAKDYGHPVYLRFAAEMNGEWNSYSVAAGGPPPSTFVLAWHRIVGIFRTVGAHNVKFIWCINEADEPATAANKAENYWPGASYVDIMGFDGYNWSSQEPRRAVGGWRTFNQIVATPYQRLLDLSDKPIWICEYGCAERTAQDPVGVSKGVWFEDMFTTLLYPRLEGLVYFSDNDLVLKRDWRINSSVGAATGWRDGWLS